MIVLSFSHDLKKLSSRMTDLQRNQLPYATALALNGTAQKVKEAEVEEMKRVFDRPKPFTLKSLYVRFAKKTHLEAAVYFKDFATGGVPAGKYLRPQIEGGSRRQKASERQLSAAGLMGNAGFWVPGPGASLDQYGNVSGSFMNKVLSQVKARQDPTQNETARSRKRKRGPRYFAIRPGNRLHAGIWERRGRQIKLVLAFVNEVSYRKRFDFYGIAQRTIPRVFPIEFAKAFKKAEATAK